MNKKLQILFIPAIFALLCIGLNAQNEKRGPDIIVPQNSVSRNALPDMLTPFRGPTTETLITIKTSPYPARIGTVANPFGNQVGSGTGGAVQCLEYIDGVIYGVRYASSANQFGTINPTTGVFTVLKANFHTQGSDASSMAYNPVDQKTYVFPWTASDSQGSRFGTVDLATGNFTTIATWTADGSKTYYAAIDEDGTCYALRNNTNEFGTIDLTTGNFTLKTTLLSAGITDVYYIQDLSFDRETGELYWVGTTNYNTTTQVTTNNHFWKIDKNTGALTDLGANTLMPQGFCIRNWFDPSASVTITTNVLPAGTGTVTGGGTYQKGDPVTLTAIANEGFVFDKWTPGNSTANPLTFNATASATYTANFKSAYACDPPKSLDVTYATDCSKATLNWSAPSKGRGVLLSEGFESGGTPAGWQFIKTGSGLDWQVVDKLVDENQNPVVFPHSGEYFATNLWKDGAARNAWMISKGFDLVAGTEYTITWWMKMEGYPPLSEKDKIKVCLGNAQTAAAMEAGALIYKNETTPVVTWTKMEYKHKPTTSGTFYLGFHAYSANSEGNDIDIDDVEITDGGATATVSYNVYRGETKLTSTPITATTFDDTTFEKDKAYTWSVKVACAGGGESAAASKAMEACEKCVPVTAPTVSFEGCAKAIVTWTAVTGAKEYEVTRDGVTTKVTTPPFTDVAAFESSKTYTWTIVAVCEGGKSTAVSVSGTGCVGIKEASNTFSILPNPTTKDITIKANSSFSKVEVLSFLGQVVMTQINTNDELTLDVSQLTNGVYFIRIATENGTSVKKFVKQ